MQTRISLCKVAGAFVSPNGMRLNRGPIVNAVLCLSASFTSTCQYPAHKSKLEHHLALERASNVSSIRGKACASTVKTSVIYAKSQAVIFLAHQHNWKSKWTLTDVYHIAIQFLLYMLSYLLKRIGRYPSVSLLERLLFSQPDFMPNCFSWTQIKIALSEHMPPLKKQFFYNFARVLIKVCSVQTKPIEKHTWICLCGSPDVSWQVRHWGQKSHLPSVYLMLKPQVFALCLCLCISAYLTPCNIFSSSASWVVSSLRASSVCSTSLPFALLLACWA